MKKNGCTIIFWGAAWGLVEATLGYLLHMLPFSIGWLFWFPLAFYYMRNAHKHTGSLRAIMYTAFIAACIKLTNLLLSVRVDKVINPAVSIILEGMVVFAAYWVSNRKPKIFEYRFLGTLGVSYSWRVLYLLYALLIMPQWMFALSAWKSAESLARFMLLEGTAGGLVIYACMRIAPLVSKLPVARIIKEGPLRRGWNQWVMNNKLLENRIFTSAASLCVLAAAIIVQWML